MLSILTNTHKHKTHAQTKTKTQKINFMQNTHPNKMCKTCTYIPTQICVYVDREMNN